MSEHAKLTRGSIRGHLVSQTLPMVFGIAAMTSVGIVDAYFVGNLGADELAAISFIFPVTIALTSLGVGVLVGINSIVSRGLGAGDPARAERRGNQGFVFAVLLGLTMGGLLFALRQPLFRLMNADETLLPLIDAYMRPFAMGFPLLLVSMGANGILRGQGEALKSSSILMTIAAANWILDPLLIAGWGPFPSYGIAGAAYASVGAFAAAAVVAVTLVQFGRLKLRISRLRGGDWGQGLRAFARVGAPAAFANSINPIGLSVLTGLLATYGADAVAGFGAAGRVQSFAVVPLLAMSSAIGPIVGQNWGAGRADRARLALKEASLFSLVYGLAIAALLVGFRSDVGQIFTDNGAVMSAIERYFMIAAWGYCGFGVLIVTNGALNAVDKSTTALSVSGARVLLIMLPAAYFGGRLFGADMVYGAELAANILGGALAFWIGTRALSDAACPYGGAGRPVAAE